jgi:hypothetical protein
MASALALSLGFTSPSSLVDTIWSHFASLWQGTEAGCGADPNGSLPASLNHSDEGGGCDPNGGCLPASTDHADEGCGMDPNGRCNPGS